MAAPKRKPLIDRVVAKLNRAKPDKDDNGTIEVSRTSNRILSAVKYVLKTGIRPLDELTGGLPFGRVVEIYGLESSGKTAAVIRSSIKAQLGEIYERVTDGEPGETLYRKIELEECDITVLYVDNEGSLEDDDKIRYKSEYDTSDSPPTLLDVPQAQTDTIMQMFKLMDRTIELLEQEEKETKRMQFLVVVVDTIASTSTSEEVSSDWGKVDYQRQPKQLREGFRRMIRQINKHNVCMICVNQVSEKFTPPTPGKRRVMTNVPQDDDHSTFGGKAIKYYATLRVFMYKLGTIKLSPTRRFPDGLLVGFKTTKNRIKKPYREGRLALLYDGGYSDAYSVLETLLFTGYAGYGTKGAIFFRFAKYKIPTETFSLSDSSIDEDDRDSDNERSNPKISCKADWFQFYLAHKSDFDKMWAAAVESSFKAAAVGVEEDDEGGDVDDVGD